TGRLPGREQVGGNRWVDGDSRECHTERSLPGGTGRSNRRSGGRGHGSQPTAHSPQPTAHSPQPYDWHICSFPALDRESLVSLYGRLVVPFRCGAYAAGHYFTWIVVSSALVPLLTSRGRASAAPGFKICAGTVAPAGGMDSGAPSRTSTPRRSVPRSS